MADKVVWHAPHPINDLNGIDAVVEQFWRPLRAAFPDLKRRCDLLIGGHEHWVGAIGYFDGVFTEDWIGIPATGRPTQIRFGEFYAVYEGKIIVAYIILDILDVLRQAGVDVVLPGLGDEGPVAGPASHDGVFFDQRDDAEGAKTLATAKTMCGVLNRPECRSYWTEAMKWYGPSGIGTTTGYDDFDAKHQAPFNHAFPAYAGSFGVHVVDVGEGNYAGWVGWPSIRALHSGVFLGCPPTGNVVEWRLMDFYRREGDLIAENWVPVDMLHLFLTMGVDIMAKLEAEVERRGAVVQQS
jgi:predicted ester cyclase